MSDKIIFAECTHFQRRVFYMLRDLETLSSVHIETNTNVLGEVLLDRIVVHSNYEFMPDFEFQWDTRQFQYRVYIQVSSTKHDKETAGYPIFNIKNILTMYGFIQMYQFIHKHRCNQK